jgi:NADPH-dependent curcumin reductase CurA
MRERMNEGASYTATVALGAPMTGETVGEVIASNDPNFVTGQIVLGARGPFSPCLTPAQSSRAAWWRLVSRALASKHRTF